MIFIIAWLIAMGSSELLLWSYGYLKILSPVLYIALCIMFLYQRKKIRYRDDLSITEKKIRVLRLGIIFIISLLAMLAISVNIDFLINIYGAL